MPSMPEKVAIPCVEVVGISLFSQSENARGAL